MFKLNLPSFIYNSTIHFTMPAYTHVLTAMKNNSFILDIGIGTASALIENADLLKEKYISVTGIDINRTYLAVAEKEIAQHFLTPLVTVSYGDICSDILHEKYDVVYFSGSFMLVAQNQKLQALKNAISVLKEGGRIYFAQTFEKKPSKCIELLKPRLKWLTTIDFGFVTYEHAFYNQLKEVNLQVIEKKVLTDSNKRSFVLVEAKVSERL